MSASLIQNPAVDSYIEESPAGFGPLLARLRKLIAASAPELNEEFKWSQPVYCLNGPVVYLAVHSDHINLGFYKGARLSDPAKILEGSGKFLRHVKIFTSSDIQVAPLKRLIRQAAKLARGA